MKVNNLVKSTGFALTLLISGTALNAPVMAGGGKFFQVSERGEKAYAYVCPQFNNLNKQMEFIKVEGITSEEMMAKKACEKPDYLPSELKSLDGKVETMKPVQQSTKGPGCFYHPLYGWFCR